MASLMAFPNLVFIDSLAGQTTGTTSILYQGNPSSTRLDLWERVDSKPWTRISPLERPASSARPVETPSSMG
jgi:hypothetical protein